MLNRFSIYVGLVCAGSLFSLLQLHGRGDASASVYLAVTLAAFGLVAELVTYKLPHGASGSVALVPFLAAALVSPSWRAAIAVAGAQAAVEIIRRRGVAKAIFNVSQALLSISVGILLYSMAGGQSMAADLQRPFAAPSTVLPVFALLGAFVLTNSLTVSAAISLSQERSFYRVWREITFSTSLYTLLSGVLAYLLAFIHARTGVVGSALLMLPLAAFRQFYITTLQLQQTNRELLELMVKAIEARDPYTSGHSRRVAHSAVIIARGIGLHAKDVERVRIAALLHDIGKIDEIYAPILRKDGKLSAEEWAIMKTHPAKGAELVATLTDLRDVVNPIRHHHEHWNGTGYPDGLSGEDIPFSARIITFADTMDALMTDRPYRKALGEEEVRMEFVRNCGTQFDPALCGQVLAPAVWDRLFSRIAVDKKITPIRSRPLAASA